MIKQSFYKRFRQAMRLVKRDKDEIDLRGVALGMNSFIDQKNDVHCVLLDYDTSNDLFVMADVCEIMEHFKLADCELYETAQGFHAIFFYDHIPYSRLVQIINFSRCDEQFKNISRYYNHKTIRSAGKYRQLEIKFFKEILSPFRRRTDHEMRLGLLKKEEYLRLHGLHDMINPSTLG